MGFEIFLLLIIKQARQDTFLDNVRCHRSFREAPGLCVKFRWTYTFQSNLAWLQDQARLHDL